MNRIKAVLCLILSLTLTTALVSCSGGAGGLTQSSEGSSSESTEEVSKDDRPLLRIGVTATPGGMSFVKLMADNEAEQTACRYEFVTGSYEQNKKGLADGSLDMAVIPSTAAANINSSDKSITAAAVCAISSYYIFDRTGSVTDAASLSGQTVFTSDMDGETAAMLTLAMSRSGVSGVKIEYADTFDDVCSQADAHDIVMLPEPWADSFTAGHPSFRQALNFNELWDVNSNGEAARELLAMSSGLASSDPRLIKKFMKEYVASVSTANADTTGSASLAIKYGLAGSGLKSSGFAFSCVCSVNSNTMKAMLQKFYDGIGTAQPDDGFYYMYQ